MKLRNPNKTAVFLTVSFVMTLTISQAQMRTWTADSGKTIEAELVQVTGTGNAATALLELKDGRRVTYPVAKLSAVDREWLSGPKKETPQATPAAPVAKNWDELILQRSGEAQDKLFEQAAVETQELRKQIFGFAKQLEPIASGLIDLEESIKDVADSMNAGQVANETSGIYHRLISALQFEACLLAGEGFACRDAITVITASSYVHTLGFLRIHLNAVPERLQIIQNRDLATRIQQRDKVFRELVQFIEKRAQDLQLQTKI